MRIAALVAGSLLLAGAVAAQGTPPGESPALGLVRVTQDQIENGELTREQLRGAGLLMFTTPFNKLDGFGDGPMNLADTVTPGGRPTLQGNGTYLRVNGLDAQTCLECHTIVSNASIPAKLGIGGVGGASANAMILATSIDPADLEDLDSIAGFNGRFANPPFIFGAGAVELVGLEMTVKLQAQKQQAIDSPGTVVQLVAKGIEFGSIVADGLGNVDTTQVVGVDPDLVVKPFGRKGEFPTTRDFDIEAMQFHFGMQPVEAVGEGVDADGDGIVNEILIGELSALHVFVATIDRPQADHATAQTVRGFNSFVTAGCAGCHVPELNTNTTELPLRFPMVRTDPEANVYYRVDLTKQPTRFERNDQGGISVPLFADLKRHDMGDGLAETFALVDSQRNREFTTARLWGVADTAPYMHDGRATTLTEAILMHGGEAQEERDAFAALPAGDREDLIAFLRSLRTPENPLQSGPGNSNRPRPGSPRAEVQAVPLSRP